MSQILTKMTNRTFSILLFLLSCCSISFIGTTIWLLLERNDNESCSVDGFLHQGKHGQIKLSKNGNLELMNDQKWTVYGSLGSHVKNASPVSCSERDFCLGKFSRLLVLIKSEGRPVYGHLQRPSLHGPPKFMSFAEKPFAA